MADERTTEVIPLVEEELRLEKRSSAAGKVRVRTETELVEEIARATLDGENVEVTRVPVGREIGAAPAVRTEGDVVIVPVLEEILVVEKRLFLKEELHIRRQATQETVEVPVTLRKQRGVVERLSSNDPPRLEEDKPR